jgi:hypothetical protein
MPESGILTEVLPKVILVDIGLECSAGSLISSCLGSVIIPVPMGSLSDKVLGYSSVRDRQLELRKRRTRQ